MRPTALLLAGLALTLIGCVPAARAQDHGHAAGADPHDHAPETPTVSVTQWTETMELFMEHPELIAGQPARFVIHLTVLDGFRPVRAGTVRLEFVAPDGQRTEHATDTLLRDGVFAPTVELAQAGEFALRLVYSGPAAASTFEVPGVRVHRSALTAHTARAGHGDAITFLKEQQWKVPFATAWAQEREIRRSVWAIAHVLPAPTAYVEITAPTDGVVQVAEAGALAVPGARVQRGDVVARIAPPLQGEGWTASRLALAQARRNWERARRLREQDAISEREFEEAENAYLARQAGHERLAGSGDGGVLTLTAPIDGQVIEWQVAPGQRVQAGDHLMAIADPSLVWLRVNVYESDFRTLGTPVGAWIDDGEGGWTVPASALEVLTTGGALDPVTRTVPVLLEIANGDGRLAIHASTPVELHTSAGGRATVVPRTAVFEDGGVDVVFVQVGGEAFVKRVVRAGPTYAEWISILDGVAPGERVVVRGGYLVKLAATTAEIGHGHAH